ncbi:DUF4917 family protein [Patulibacter sp. SYSU D01012]|uniref:DUF4917 family protein n=1 Tax=Patulibacter sp. SYSU D01012 TaxID=2817381 RepID=UPI001B30EF17|nr:DUF4917 family protein [Patulibacter sp. SYSU D01012]
MGHALDGSLATWSALEDEHEWRTLLVGNGLSMHLCADFGYTSLFDEACEAGRLDPTEQALFAAIDTENFELVLAALSSAILVADAIGDASEHLLEFYGRVQDSLGAAVRGVHPPLGRFPLEARRGLREVLRSYRRVFTTSYDLGIYWAAASGTAEEGPTFDGFKDRLWSNGRAEFDPRNADVVGDTSSTQTFYLHGALHLVVDAAGVTRKLTNRRRSILDQFGKPIAGEPTARPLLVTEGDWADKLEAIHGNDYLLHCLRELRRDTGPVVVFGHSLSPQDEHLARALNRHAGRCIAVGIRDKGPAQNRARQRELANALPDVDLFFFESATHPLSDPAFTMTDS